MFFLLAFDLLFPGVLGVHYAVQTHDGVGQVLGAFGLFKRFHGRRHAPFHLLLHLFVDAVLQFLGGRTRGGNAGSARGGLSPHAGRRCDTVEGEYQY